MRRGRWVVYKIISGSVVEKVKAWRCGESSGRRKRVRGSSTLKKLEANLRSAVKNLARILNCNFSEKDLFLKLGYDDAALPADWRQQEKTVELFIRRLKKQLKRQGCGQVKWVSVCSEKNSRTGEAARPHVHLVISGEGMTFHNGQWWCGEKSLEEIWGMGGVYGEPLRRMSDYTPLALYLLRQAGRETDRKKYHVSRNMDKPVVEEYDVLTDRELRAPAGAVVVDKRYDVLTGANYIRYIAPPKRTRTGKGARHATE